MVNKKYPGGEALTHALEKLQYEWAVFNSGEFRGLNQSFTENTEELAYDEPQGHKLFRGGADASDSWTQQWEDPPLQKGKGKRKHSRSGSRSQSKVAGRGVLLHRCRT